MPKLTITISANATARLQTVVDKFNTSNNSNFTIKQWMIRLLKQHAFQAEYTEAMQTITQQREAAKNRAIETKMAEIEASLTNEIT